MEDFSELLSALAGLGAGVLATVAVFRRRVLPLLETIAENSKPKWDDKAVSDLARILGYFDEEDFEEGDEDA